MKQKLVGGVRKLLPPNAVRAVEDAYRKGRTKLVSARYGYPARGLRIIGVTGTSGKTTTISYLNEVLKEAGLKTAMFSTALIEIAGKARPNLSHPTVVATGQLQEFFRDAKRAEVDFVVMEVSSHTLDQHRLASVAFEVAVMTNLSAEHLEYHQTMENYAHAKGRLFAHQPKFIVLNRDDDWYDFFNEYQPGQQKITYGQHQDAEAKIDYVKLYRKGSEAIVVIDHQTKLDLATALPGKFNVYNMTAAVAAAYLLGVRVNDIIEGVANLEGVPGRFERVVDGLGYDVVVDYARSPEALSTLLDSAKAIAKNRVILVFGAEGGRDTDKRPRLGEVAANLADRIVLTDEDSFKEDPMQIRAQIRAGIEAAGGEGRLTEIADRRTAIEKALSIARKGDMVVIAGMGHEQLRSVEGSLVPWSDAAVVRELLAAQKHAKHEDKDAS